MKATVTLNVQAKPAIDMQWAVSDDMHLLSTMPFEDVMKGFKLDKSALQQVVWIPVNLSDEDYAALRNVHVEIPDYIPLFCGECLGGVVKFHATVESGCGVDDLIVEFDFGDLHVYSNTLPHWWAAERAKRGYVA